MGWWWWWRKDWRCEGLGEVRAGRGGGGGEEGEGWWENDWRC